MFKSKTVFIVGAGASAEVGLPVGSQLKDDIARRLDIREGWSREPISGDEGILTAFFDAVEDQPAEWKGDIKLFLNSGWAIRDAMPQAISIDNFVDAHRDDPQIALCAKLAIIKSILDAEGNSQLKENDERHNINFGMIAGSWLSEYFKLASELISRNESKNILDNTSLIIFNYDRCIEHYLSHAIHNYYKIDKTTARAIVESVAIYHPYGVAGSLPWQSGGLSVPFGETRAGRSLLDIATQIKTFTEQTEDHESLAAMRKRVEEAETLVFLGFAFHPQNMELITPEAPSKVRRVFATAMGFSDHDCAAIKADICDMLGHDQADIQLRNDLTCARLFQEYRRSLTRV
jgi:hypothetical protein